jgi:uncharacterized protein (DUF1778 family)
MPPLSKTEDEHVTEFISRTAVRRERAAFRPTSDQKALFERAASLEGQSLSEFMRQAVEERAKSVIADHERIVLTEQAREIFFSALINPAKPNDKLAALADRYAREVKSRP